MLTRVLLLVIGYGFGLIQTGYLLSKYVLHQDIRTQGSGNSGATNALRVFGLKVGLLTFAGDLLKSLIYCCVIKYALGSFFGEERELMMLYGGLGVVLGHCYPFYMNFKGGKGVSSTAGMILSYDLKISAILLTIFLVVVIAKRYVSLGSLCVVTFFFLLSLVFDAAKLHPIPASCRVETIVLILIFTALCYFAHRANIVRLLNGTENPISIGKEKK